MLLIGCWPCGFVLQSEVDNLSLEEQRLDDQIRLYGCFISQKGEIYITILLSNAFEPLLTGKCKKD
jgi:hypothetical protein